MEEPCFGVQAGATGVVADLQAGAERGQRVEGPPFRSSNVGSGEDAKPARPALQEAAERVLEHPEAGPLEERAEQVDAVGRGEFAAYLGADTHVVVSVDEEFAGGEPR